MMYEKKGAVNYISFETCRICLTEKSTLSLFNYQLSKNYAEMLTAIAEVKVMANDGLPEKICSKCSTILEKAYLLKTVAERSDKKLRKALANKLKKAPTKKIVFDSFTDVQSEFGALVKTEPKWEIEVKDNISLTPNDNIDGKKIVIANTIIKKIDPNSPNQGSNQQTNVDPQPDVSVVKCENLTANNSDDDLFVDDVNDVDYEPPEKKSKSKFKKPKLCNIKVFKEKPGKKTVKVLHVLQGNKPKSSNPIICFPLMRNGSKGAPIILRRPKDSTVLKCPLKSRVVKGEQNKVDKINREKTPKQKERLVCPVCGILTYALGNHMATHDESKRFSCPDCPKKFMQKGNLEVHMKRHTGVKDQICEVCGTGFYSQKSLIRHNLIHTGERPYPCTLCSKKFIARCDLNRHMRIHAGYKPFKCSMCTMSFNAKHQLQNHERMHTGERPYTCEICNVAFSYKVNLNNHVWKMHNVNLKFKSIYTMTEEVLQREIEQAVASVMPRIVDTKHAPDADA